MYKSLNFGLFYLFFFRLFSFNCLIVKNIFSSIHVLVAQFGQTVQRTKTCTLKILNFDTKTPQIFNNRRRHFTSSNTLFKIPMKSLCYAMLYHTKLYYTKLYYIILYYTKLHYTTLHYTKLLYTTLHYTILYLNHLNGKRGTTNSLGVPLHT